MSALGCEIQQREYALNLTRPQFLLPLIFVIGLLQYGAVAMQSIAQGDVALWQIDDAALTGAGISRYFKDVFLVLFAAWPIFIARRSLSSEMVRIFRAYLIWLAAIILLGTTGHVIFDTPTIFLLAGLRWILLLHCALGLFLLMRTWVQPGARQWRLFYALFILVVADLAVAFTQLNIGFALYEVGFARSRVTGLFSNAGVAAFFAFGIALVAVHLDNVRFTPRMVLIAGCIGIALTSGTRSMVLSILAVGAVMLMEILERHGSSYRSLLKLVILITVFTGGAYAYVQLISLVDRGGMIETQFQAGGRVANAIETLYLLGQADPVELLVGRGLGTGTNTAYGALTASGVQPEIFRFNLLVDNAFLTQFFQFGIIGSMVFWGGLLVFLKSAKPKGAVLRRRYWVAVTLLFLITLSGNLFEQYFLMFGFAAALGIGYWSDQVPELP